MNAKLLETEVLSGTPQPAPSRRRAGGVALVLALAGCEGRTPTCEVEPGSEATGRLRISLDLDDSDPLADEMRAKFEGQAFLVVDHRDEFPGDCTSDPDADTLLSAMVDLGWHDSYSFQAGWACGDAEFSVHEYGDTAYEILTTCIRCWAHSEPTCIDSETPTRMDLRATCSDECEAPGD